MRADICGSLFNGAPQQATLTAMQRYNATKEVVIYDSLVWDNFEHANFTDTMKMAEQYARRYPELQNEYEKEFALQNENDEDDDRYFIAFIDQHSMYDNNCMQRRCSIDVCYPISDTVYYLIGTKNMMML